MTDQRLDAWIPEELKSYLAERAKREGNKGMNQVLADILRAEIAREQGTIIEQQSLPVIREIVQTELRKALAQHRTDLLESLTIEVKTALSATANRLAALLVMTARDSIIARRMLYAILSRAYGADFAMQAYEDARVKAGKEMSSRRNKEEGEG